MMTTRALPVRRVMTRSGTAQRRPRLGDIVVATPWGNVVTNERELWRETKRILSGEGKRIMRETQAILNLGTAAKRRPPTCKAAAGRKTSLADARRIIDAQQRSLRLSVPHDDQLRVAAIHEAGHAVACHCRGMRVDVAMIYETDDKIGGRVQAALDDATPETWLAVVLAGPAAAQIHLGLPVNQMRLANKDWRDVYEQLGLYYQRGALPTNQEAFAWMCAEHRDRAEQMLRRNWPAVERVANGLLEKRELGAAELRELFG